MRLTYESGEHAGRTIEVDARRVVLGRAGDADIVLRGDAEISRRHLSLEPRPDGTVVLTDLGSTNGTFVDGYRITGAVSLRGGERVRVGDTTLLVERPPAAQPTMLSAGASAHAPSAAPQPPAGAPAAFQAPTGAAPPQGALPPQGAHPPAQPGAPLPIPPPPQTPSMIERVRLRRSVTRANVLALAAIGIAVVVVGAVAVLAVTGVFSSGGGGTPTTEKVVSDVTPSTVDILTRQSGRPIAGGSGWVLDANQGLIATNSHVVNGGDAWTIKVGDEQREGIFVAAAPCEDQALLRIADATGLKTIPLADQRTVKTGQAVIAVGFPVNASERDNLTATAGVVSVPRTVFTGAFDVPDLQNVIQTDAAINPGNSGGPLVNFRSQLIGMDTAGLDRADGRTIQGQGYAIGVARIKQVMARLRRGKSMGFTGFGIDPVPPSQLEAAGLPPGLHTVEAVKGSPADRAGFGDGEDRSIVSIDGRRLDGSLPQYCKVVERYRSGESATFRVGLAGGRTQIISMKFM